MFYAFKYVHDKDGVHRKRIQETLQQISRNYSYSKTLMITSWAIVLAQLFCIPFLESYSDLSLCKILDGYLNNRLNVRSYILLFGLC